MPILTDKSEQSIFLIEYKMDGKTYTVDIEAEDSRDAIRRLSAIRHDAWIAGELVKRIPFNSVTMPFAWLRMKLWIWWRTL